MCDPGSHLKLCTCAGRAPLPKPRWRIARQTAQDARRNAESLGAVGSIVMPPLEREMLRDLVRHDVNRPDAFDIEPRAGEGDVLTLEFETETVALVFREGRWEQDDWLGTQASLRIAGGRLQREARAPGDGADWRDPG